jgi:hypothetical protein
MKAVGFTIDMKTILQDLKIKKGSTKHGYMFVAAFLSVD